MKRMRRSASSSQCRLREALKREMRRMGDKSPSVSVRSNRPIRGTFHVKVVSEAFRKMTLQERYIIIGNTLIYGRIRVSDFDRVVRTELWAPGEE